MADEKESNMDAGQSDFTDPPAIRQICYWILARYQTTEIPVNVRGSGDPDTVFESNGILKEKRESETFF